MIYNKIIFIRHTIHCHFAHNGCRCNNNKNPTEKNSSNVKYYNILPIIYYFRHKSQFSDWFIICRRNAFWLAGFALSLYVECEYMSIFQKQQFFLGVLGVFHQQFRRRWNRKAQIRWNRIETDCTSKQTAIQIHPFSSDSHTEIHIQYISELYSFPLEHIFHWLRDELCRL